jgi:ectoine hydroxylase-related dioxygenase (phytanoyl-CoA dioxygenase family)
VEKVLLAVFQKTVLVKSLFNKGRIPNLQYFKPSSPKNILMSKIISKLRNYKVSYIIYNFLHRNKLKHNRDLYQNLHIKKPLYWSVNSADFAELPQHIPWLDKPTAKEDLLKNEKYLQLSPTTQQQVLEWIEKGAIILKKFLSAEEINAINLEVETLLNAKKIKPLENGKIMFAFKQSFLLKKLISDKRIIDFFEFIFQQPVLPFQTINFIKGSQQKAHSDSIHMTTYPLGYLSAAWFALEDMDETNGALFYYPGSHRLPYILSPDFDHKTGLLQLDPRTNIKYEEKIESIISEAKLEKKDFYAEKGDVFLWHANLIHGGNRISDNNRSRKSMVAHYFAKNVIKYHEISQRPALLEA